MIFFFLTFVTVNGPSHLPKRTLKTLTRSPRSIRYYVAGGSFECNALLILDSATMVSISVLASPRASNISFWFLFVFDGSGKVGSTPYTSYDGTNPFRPIVSFIDLTSILNMIRSDSC